MPNLDKLGMALWGAYKIRRFPYPVLLPMSASGFHLLLSVGKLDVFPDRGDEGQNLAVIRWAQVVTQGNLLGAAESIARLEQQNDWLTGDLVFYDANEWGVHDAAVGDKVLQYQLALRNNDDLTLEDFANALEREVGKLLEVLELFDEFVERRDDNDRTLEADEHDWPGAVQTLLDDSTSTAVLGIIFQRFEENSVHEHVFYHPNADQSLRERIVRSWDSIAGSDRPQPYGDPEASSGSFSTQRAESIEYLRRDLA